MAGYILSYGIENQCEIVWKVTPIYVILVFFPIIFKSIVIRGVFFFRKI